MIAKTSTYWKIKNSKKRIKVLQGGSGSGKNYGVALILLEKALEKRRLITVMSDTYDNLLDGIITDYTNMFEMNGLNFKDYYNQQEKYFKWGQSKIQFRYIKDAPKKATNAGKSKRRDILYINEANKVGWTVASTYIGRTHEDVYIDFNPDYEFWAHTEVPKMRDENGDQESELIITTYRDNEACPQSEINMIESRKDDAEWYRVYGLGETGTYSERAIYKYQMFNMEDLPLTAKRIPSGQDYGMSPDPTNLVNMWMDGANLYIDTVFSENNLMPEKLEGTERMSIVDKMEEVKFPKGHLIIADSAGRKEILDLRKHGYNIHGIVKKPGGQKEGIKLVRGYNLFCTPRSTTFRTGCEMWFYKVDPNGKIIPEPEGHEPDDLVVVRYVMMAKDRVW